MSISRKRKYIVAKIKLTSVTS